MLPQHINSAKLPLSRDIQPCLSIAAIIIASKVIIREMFRVDMTKDFIGSVELSLFPNSIGVKAMEQWIPSTFFAIEYGAC